MKIKGPDNFGIPAVGEANYQNDLGALGGGSVRSDKAAFFDASLVLEDSNPYDDQAVRVDVGGRTVGYLSRDHARQFRARVTEAGLAGETTCRCKMIGSSGRIGVWLDLPVAVGSLR